MIRGNKLAGLLRYVLVAVLSALISIDTFYYVRLLQTPFPDATIGGPQAIAQYWAYFDVFWLFVHFRIYALLFGIFASTAFPIRGVPLGLKIWRRFSNLSVAIRGIFFSVNLFGLASVWLGNYANNAPFHATNACYTVTFTAQAFDSAGDPLSNPEDFSLGNYYCTSGLNG